MKPVLEIRDAVVGYDGDPVLRGLDLDVGEGEFFVLLGPSGCGKTTLLRAVAGFEPLSSGRLSLAGRAVDQDGVSQPPESRGVGFVFQDLALWPHMSALDHLVFCLPDAKDKSSAVECAREMLRVLHIEDLEDRKPHQLSGGESQRLAIARALVAKPEVLLMDEPLSSLDPSVAREIRSLLGSICRETDTTVLYVTHLQEEAFELADRMAVMSEGRLEQVGTPMEIAERPTTAFVAEFVGNNNLVDGAWDSGDSQFRCALGEFDVGEGFRDRDSLALVIGEHEIRAGSSGGVTGEVVESVYRGFRYSTRVRVADTLVWASDDRKRTAGDSVSLGVPENAWFVPANGVSS